MRLLLILSDYKVVVDGLRNVTSRVLDVLEGLRNDKVGDARAVLIAAEIEWHVHCTSDSQPALNRKSVV